MASGEAPRTALSSAFFATAFIVAGSFVVVADVLAFVLLRPPVRQSEAVAKERSRETGPAVGS